MKIKILLILLIIPAFIFAQNYTLEELLDQALKNNVTLKQSKINLESSKARLHSARINYLPDLSMGVSRTELLPGDSSYDFRSENDSLSTGTDNAYISLTKTISLNNDSYFSNKNAKHDYTIAIINDEIQIQNTIFDIISSYLNILESQKKITLLEENIRIQEGIVSESNSLYRQNKITQFQVQQSEINLLNARISLLSAQNNLNVSRKRLFNLINISDDGRDLAEVTLYTEEFTDGFHRELIMENILQIRHHEESVNKHRTNISQTKLDFFPQINLSYRLNRDLSSDDFTYNNGRTSHTIGLGLSYSFNRLFRNHYSYKQVMYLDEQNKLNTSQLINDISLKYNQYIEELRYLEQLDILLDNRLAQTTTNLEMAQQRYRLGLVTQLDIEKAIYDNLDAQLNKETNRYQLILKKLNIDHLLSNKVYNY